MASAASGAGEAVRCTLPLERNSQRITQSQSILGVVLTVQTNYHRFLHAHVLCWGVHAQPPWCTQADALFPLVFLHIQTDAHTILNTVVHFLHAFKKRHVPADTFPPRLLHPPPNTHLVFSNAVSVSIRPRMHSVTETFLFCMMSSWRSELKKPSSANLVAE